MTSRKRGIRQAAIVQVFAERLRGLRTSRSMTQRELADQADVTLSYVSRLEAGGAAPGIDLLERLAKALQVGLNELLPAPPAAEPVEAHRQQVRAGLEAVLAKSGRDTLTMLNTLFKALVESSATNR
ncbi:MAG TPA: helix-turn-helix transcriptional regulator [Gemmataceae bacterium]|nr:helix-turn-helix transcriptional regulator [Gemmataceae bacterium]